MLQQQSSSSSSSTHHYHSGNIGNNNYHPCVDRRLFISFRDQTFYDIKIPTNNNSSNDSGSNSSSDQIDLITTPGSHCFCSTERGQIIRCDLVDNVPVVEVVPTSTEFSNDLTRVKFLLSGYYHVIAIKESDKVYVHVLSENSQYGTLENKSSTATEPFSLVSTKHFMKDKTITHAACGTYSTLLVLNNRYIYIAGRIENQLTDYSPCLLSGAGEDYPTIKSISAGYGHAVVQTMNGEVYVMGQNHYGQTLSVTSAGSFQKITSGLTGLVNIRAIRLSHITCCTTKDSFTINGYIGNELDGFSGQKSYEYSKLVDFADNLQMFGGFTSVVTFNERTRELMACGSTTNAPQTPYNILATLKRQYESNFDILAYLDHNHTVIDVSCGSSIIAVLMDALKKDTLLVNNLLKFKKYATHELVHSSDVVPFHDVLICFT